MKETDKYRTFAPRLLALLLDTVLLLPLTIAADMATEMEVGETAKQAIIFGLNVAAVVYFVAMHAIYGQTVGKMLMKVKVVDLSEAPIGFKRAIMRDIPQIIFTFLSLAPFMTAPLTENPEMQINILTLCLMAWSFADIAVFLSNDKRRALHDYIAGTVVVRIDDSFRTD